MFAIFGMIFFNVLWSVEVPKTNSPMVDLTLLSNQAGGFSNENLYITYYWSFCN